MGVKSLFQVGTKRRDGLESYLSTRNETEVVRLVVRVSGTIIELNFNVELEFTLSSRILVYENLLDFLYYFDSSVYSPERGT